MQRPLSIVGAIALAAMLAACSNSANSGASSSSGNDAAAAASAAPVAAAPAQNGASANDGAGVYSTNCSSCHQTNGAGLPGAFPPLAKNPVVTGDPATVIHIVKFGLNGKVQAGGQTYNGTMPAWGQNLSNDQIASVVTFVRASWGNRASAVSAADVAASK